MKRYPIFNAAGVAATAGLLLFVGCFNQPDEPDEPDVGGETTYTLTTTANPAAGGTVSRTPNRDKYADGDEVVVTATAKDGYTFSGWSGAATETTNPVTIVMDGNKSITALFVTGSVTPPQLGTPDTSWYATNELAVTYTITTADELAGLAKLVNDGNMFAGKTIVLGNDISLSNYGALNTTFNSGRGWVPIGRYGSSTAPARPFSGTFNGSGYEISGLYINNTSQSYAGVFGHIDGGEIKDLGVVGVDINGGEYLGAVVGRLNGGNVENCYSSGSIRGGRGGIGGLIGIITNSSAVTTSYSTATVRGGNGTGGLVGGVSNMGSVTATISNCYALGSVNGSNNVGGLVGNFFGIKISNCYATGDVIGNSDVGGVAGTPTAGDQTYSIINNVALNSDIQASSAGRVFGYYNYGPFAQNNAGFVGITLNGNAVTWDTETGRNPARNGVDITIAEILADPTMGNRFRAVAGWTIEEGKLPGLLGKAVDLPAHLQAAN